MLSIIPQLFTTIGGFLLGIVAGVLLRDEVGGLGAVILMFIGVAFLIFGQVNVFKQKERGKEQKQG
ncbi:MAG: hypothetical protein A2W23_06815 [Planctomycetes bacterium RBG_16_43_13]|nr:MAG: hypothetical protein A2W23_06815 [Planctomycetes bacterium RBG_16_43_13]